MDFLYRLMPPARWRLLCMALLVLALFCSISTYTDGNLDYQTASMICLALAIGGTFCFWRCPRCHSVLPLKNMMYLKECPKCHSDVRNFKN